LYLYSAQVYLYSAQVYMLAFFMFFLGSAFRTYIWLDSHTNLMNKWNKYPNLNRNCKCPSSGLFQYSIQEEKLKVISLLLSWKEKSKVISLLLSCVQQRVFRNLWQHHNIYIYRFLRAVLKHHTPKFSDLLMNCTAAWWFKINPC
jgi:hypothetical protein